MKKNVIICMLLILPLTAFSQFGSLDEEEIDVKELPTKERLFVGGFIGLQFGTYTSVSLNTLAGYRITNRLSAGIGGTYQYSNDRFGGPSLVSHIYGGGVFSRFRIIDKAFIHAEHEWLSVISRMDWIADGNKQRITETNFLVGPGYGIALSPRANLNILLLYNFNENSQVYLDNPFFRVGLDISL